MITNFRMCIVQVLEEGNVESGSVVPLRFVKFQNVSTLVIYVGKWKVRRFDAAAPL